MNNESLLDCPFCGCPAMTEGGGTSRKRGSIPPAYSEHLGRQVMVYTANAAGQGRREATYPEPACSALYSDEPDEREERCDSCGEVSCCLMRGLCPICYEVNGGTHD